MADAWMETDGLTPAQRRYLVDRARANLRRRGMEQSPALYQLYELYVAGVYTRRELQAELTKLRAARTQTWAHN